MGGKKKVLVKRILEDEAAAGDEERLAANLGSLGVRDRP